MEAAEASSSSASAEIVAASASDAPATVSASDSTAEASASTATAAASTPSQQSTAVEKDPEPEKPVFSCVVCGLVETCDYYGNTPPFTKPIGFKESVYIMRDPFSPPGISTKSSTSYLLLGGECSICGASVCVDQTSCSIFYAKRFCIRCAKHNYQRFPIEIQKEISKIIASHESASSSEQPSVPDTK